MNNLRIPMLLKYIEEDPGDTFSKYALALEYIKEGNNKEAEKLMEELFTNHPSYLANYYHYGKLLENEGRIEDASAIYQSGIATAKQQGDQHTLSELNSALEGIA